MHAPPIPQAMPPAKLLPLPGRPPAALGVLIIHGVLLAVVLQTDLLQRVLPVAVPVSVSLLGAPERPNLEPQRAQPPGPLPAPPRPAAPVLPGLAPPPVEQLPAPTVPAAHAPVLPARDVVAAPAPAEVGAAAAAVPGPAPVPAPTPAPVVPAEPRQIPPGAIGYRVPPAVAVPLASRRLRESGTVWLRVRVDRQGLPVQVTLHKSSGFARLDEQALVAMQAARFVPQTENGTAIDWVVIAPLAYDID